MSKNLTTLCYIEKDDCYLMLHRVSKKKDANAGKWIGVGGHFEEGESPEECLEREVYEETGLKLTSYRLRGIVTFVSDQWDCEYMHLYTADGVESWEPLEEDKQDREEEEGRTGRLRSCPEGELHWIPKKDIFQYSLWEGDRIFLRLLLKSDEIFSLKLRYKGEKLVEWKVREWS